MRKGKILTGQEVRVRNRHRAPRNLSKLSNAQRDPLYRSFMDAARDHGGEGSDRHIERDSLADGIRRCTGWPAAPASCVVAISALPARAPVQSSSALQFRAFKKAGAAAASAHTSTLGDALSDDAYASRTARSTAAGSGKVISAKSGSPARVSVPK